MSKAVVEKLKKQLKEAKAEGRGIPQYNPFDLDFISEENHVKKMCIMQKVITLLDTIKLLEEREYDE